MASKTKLKISILGSGNLAWHLAPALENLGYDIQEIYSRKLAHAEKLSAKIYESNTQDHLDFSSSQADIFLIAVSDFAIESIINEAVFPPHALIVHTSGTTSIDILNRFKNHAVFYPVQTFSKSCMILFKGIPIAIEASNENSKQLLASIADNLSGNYTFLESEDRRSLHLAAVFACNFTNHLLGIAQQILGERDLEMTILQPLIKETIYKAMTSESAFEVQTGPAVRRDTTTLKNHLQLLIGNPEYQEIYKVLSENIVAESLK